jgi:hypothetical protein
MEFENIKHECELFSKKMMQLNPNAMVEFNVYDSNEMAKDLETLGDKMDKLVDKMDFELLWYNWFRKYPPNKEIIEFNKMTKSKQMEFLINKEKINGNK